MFENEVGSVHKAEDSWGGEGRCLLLFRLKEMFLKPKVISSQAGCNRALQLPNCIWSHSVSLAAEAAGWGAAVSLGYKGIRASSGLVSVRGSVQSAFPGGRYLICPHTESYRTRWAESLWCCWSFGQEPSAGDELVSYRLSHFCSHNDCCICAFIPLLHG